MFFAFTSTFTRAPRPVADHTAPAELVRLNRLTAAFLMSSRDADVPILLRKSLAVAREAYLDELDPGLADIARCAEQAWQHNRLKLAERLYARAVRLARQSLGRGDRATLLPKLGWAAVWADTGRVHHAVPLLEDVLEMLSDEFGSANPVCELTRLVWRYAQRVALLSPTSEMDPPDLLSRLIHAWRCR